MLNYGVNFMSDEKKELEESILEEFEWALQDPNEQKIRQLGEVVSIITTKLTEAITNLQISVMDLESQVAGMESRMASMGRAPAGGAAAADPAAGGEPIPTMAKAPTPRPAAGTPGGPTTMMGELKQLLAARRSKADG
jgi:predicted house-cleaning noncanonical NTP pyrophosphatase (MazG superfamily)